LENKLSELLLLDVTPLSLSVETVGGEISTLIKRNSTIPVKKTSSFVTQEGNHTEALAQVLFEGEHSKAKDNNLLGMFTFNGIPRRHGGEVEIEISFDIDANGILNVTAIKTSTRKKSKITTIVNDKGRLSQKEISRMTKEAKHHHQARRLCQRDLC
jgi:L1 cell adhesion molecule like protein